MRIAVAVTVACLGLISLSTADEVKASIKQPTHIPAQKLGPALASLAKDRELQVLYRTETVGEMRTHGATGELTFHEALTELLQGTGLSYRFIDDKTVKIFVTGEEGGSAPQRAVSGKTDSTAAASPNDVTAGSAKRSSVAEQSAPKPSFWSRFRLAQAETQTETAPGATPSDGVALDEIVVTAQKRTERLRDVPMSIAVVSGADLDRSTAEGFTEALNRVPGVITTAPLQGGAAQIAVRGVTSGAGFQSGASPIAYYLDSVPFGLVKTALVPDSNAYDLERIEVLRGPQGTLYGASAQNGVVRVITRDADLDSFELKARGALSSTRNASENYRGDLAVNVPIIEGKLAARAVVGYQNLSGWIDKPGDEGANDAQLRTYRLKLNAQPTEALSIGLSAWRSVSDYGAPSAGDENRQRSTPADESIESDYDVFGLKVGYEFSGVTLTSSTGYLDYDFGSDLDYFYPFTGGALSGVLFTGMDSRIFSQEVVLNSADEGAWRWSVGGAYRDGKDSLVQTLFIFPGPIAFSDTSKSFAVFGELTRKFLEGRFELTGGLRYFKDEVTHIEDSAQPPALPTDPVLAPNKAKFHKTSPRLVLSWHPDAESTVYASYSEGFRSGFNQNANIIRLAPAWPALKPDNLKNYELGAKGSWLDGRINYDSAVYFIDWQDVQSALTVNFDGAPLAALVNGESASGVGAEFGLSAQPVRGLLLGASVSWNDLEADQAFVPAPGVDIQGLYAAGDRLNFSSKYTGGATLDYTFPLGAGGYGGRFSASANYASKQTYRNILAGAVVVDVGKAQTIARSSFSVESPNHWTATLFVDNLTNEQDPGVGLFHIPDWTQRARPRTVGLQFEYDFH